MATGDGRCEAWAELFVDVLYANGIDQEDEYLEIQFPEGSETQAFLAGNWTFRGTPGVFSTDASFPYVYVFKRDPIPLYTDGAYLADFTEVTYAQTPAQGHANPYAHFEDHAIVRLQVSGTTIYYDPSYGNAYAVSTLGKRRRSRVTGNRALLS
jgi:hypothetical protein